MTLRRLLPLSGIVFVALIALGVMLGGSTPASTAAGSKVASYYDSHQARMVIVSFVLATAGFFIVVFASTLGRSLSPAEGHVEQIWDRVLLGGGIVFATAAGVVGAINFALADNPTKISGSALQSLNLFVNDTWVLWNAALGIFMLGAAGAWLTSARGRRWVGWIALVLGVALFIPFADFFALLASGLWIIGTSIALFRESPHPAYAAAPSAA
jgi:hypothetical protein